MGSRYMDMIGLNGNRYGALTGASMGSMNSTDKQAPIARPSRTVAASAHHAPRARIAGAAQPIAQTAAQSIAKPAAQPIAPVASAMPQTPAAAIQRKLSPQAYQPNQAQHLPAHKPQHTKTLMRSAVKSPHKLSAALPHASSLSAAQPAPAKSQLATAKPYHSLAIAKPGGQQAAAMAVKPAQPSPIQSKAAVTSIDPFRSQRAAVAGRNRLVQHFQTSEMLPQSKPLPSAVPASADIRLAAAARQAASSKPAPAIAPPISTPSKAAATTPSLQAAAQPRPMQQVQTVPAALAAQPQPVKPASYPPTPQLAQSGCPAARPFRRQAARSYAGAPLPGRRPAAHANQGADQEEDIFEKALAVANSHKQKPPKESVLRAARRRKKLRQIISIAACTAVFLLLAGFIAYQNKASIELQLASAKAGFPASTPGYKPTGFAMNQITYSPGVVATWFTNRDKTFSIIQKKSNWDSQTLLDNFVATTNQDYQGYEANGRTIYVYGSGRATWVNGGIWYQVQAGSTLDREQLIKLAASM